MKKLIVAFLTTGWFAINAYAQTVSFVGVAKNKNGEVVYTEKNEAIFKEGKVLSSKATYFDTKGKVIATLESDYSKSLTAPQYVFRDLRFSDHHGIRYEAEKAFMYNTQDSKEEKEEVGPSRRDEELLVGCQGLHYYLIGHLEKLKEKRKLPVKMLIPGRLDAFSFGLSFEGEEDGRIKLSLAASSIFIKIFAPKLVVYYEKSTNKLVRYEGPSNIKDNAGDIQSVTIDYSYEKQP